MKKIGLLAMAAVLAMSIALTGCGEEVKKVEDKVGEEVSNVVAEGEKFVDEAIEAIKGETSTLLTDLGLAEKATVEVVKEDADTVKYKFTVLEQDAETEAKAIEEKIEGAADKFAAKVTELKDKGVEEAKVAIEFVDYEGKELYSKIFK